jgi:hypothetical protein
VPFGPATGPATQAETVSSLSFPEALKAVMTLTLCVGSMYGAGYLSELSLCSSTRCDVLYSSRQCILNSFCIYITLFSGPNIRSGGLGVKRDTSNVEIRGSNPRRSFLLLFFNIFFKISDIIVGAAPKRFKRTGLQAYSLHMMSSTLRHITLRSRVLKHNCLALYVS